MTEDQVRQLIREEAKRIGLIESKWWWWLRLLFFVAILVAIGGANLRLERMIETNAALERIESRRTNDRLWLHDQRAFGQELSGREARALREAAEAAR